MLAVQSRRVFMAAAVAQESLLIYFVHLCIVYRSIWNDGLYQLYGEALPPAARWVSVAIGAWLLLLLL